MNGVSVTYILHRTKNVHCGILTFHTYIYLYTDTRNHSKKIGTLTFLIYVNNDKKMGTIKLDSMAKRIKLIYRNNKVVLNRITFLLSICT